MSRAVTLREARPLDSPPIEEPRTRSRVPRPVRDSARRSGRWLASVDERISVAALPVLRPAPDAQALMAADANHDRLAAFRQAILTIRTITTSMSVVLAAPTIVRGDRALAGWCILVVVYAVFRILQPLRYTGDTPSLVRVLTEVGVTVLAVAATGYWRSPLVFSLLTAVAVAGFARGFGFAVRIALASAAAVALPDVFQRDFMHNDFQISFQWAMELLLVGLIAGYARRIMGETDRQHHLALDRLGKLSDANDLLFSLHQVTQNLPASLDLDEVLDSTFGQMRELFHFDAAALLIPDETDLHWVVARAHGTRTADRFGVNELPPPLNNVLEHRGHVVQRDLRGGPGHGLAPGMDSGLYAVLEARNAVVGLVAVEFSGADRVTQRDIDLLSGLLEPAALAIDNARWFARIRTVGADEERTRIARDLHDRIAQSLAYLGFELDRLEAANADGEDLSEPLSRLRGDVRTVVGEVRDTLYDLRTDVSDGRGMASTLHDFLQRVKDRSHLEVLLDCQEHKRLPLRQERELWRIGQEAITNVERHSRASLLSVRWRCDGRTAEMVVKDDGIGFPSGRAGRLDSYGVLGMRERAAAIGASLSIVGDPEQGTTVRCVLLEA